MEQYSFVPVGVTVARAGRPAPRLAARGLPRLGLAALTGAALIAIGLAVLAADGHVGRDRPWTFIAANTLPGLALLGAGIDMVRRRPANRCGVLLVTAAVCWNLGDFEHGTSSDISLLSFAFGYWYDGFVTWAVLAYPTGRIGRRSGRLVIVAVMATLASRTLGRLLLHVPPDPAGYGTRNRFLPVTDDRWWRLVEDGFERTYSSLALVVVLLVAHRWWTSPGPSRRMLSPAVFAAGVLSVASAYQFVWGWNRDVPIVGGVRIYLVVWWAHAAIAAAFALGFVRLRRGRAAVIDVVSVLGDDTPSADLTDALSRALRDDSIAVYAWSPTQQSYVDAAGRAVDLPDVPGIAVTRIDRYGEPLGALVHDRALLEDPGLVSAVTAALRLTIDNERLTQEIERQLAEVEASRTRILAAGDAERRRIERDLHDGAQQRLVTVALGLRLADARLGPDTDPLVRQAIESAVRDLGAAIEELRDLARGIHPTVLSESGLAAAIESLADRSPVPATVSIEIAEEPSALVAATAYFAVSEALANVGKHARAATVSIRVKQLGPTLVVEVSDDGRGGADAAAGSGLRGVGDRVATVGGSMEVTSRPGRGTAVTARLPCG